MSGIKVLSAHRRAGTTDEVRVEPTVMACEADQKIYSCFALGNFESLGHQCLLRHRWSKDQASLFEQGFWSGLDSLGHQCLLRHRWSKDHALVLRSVLILWVTSACCIIAGRKFLQVLTKQFLKYNVSF